MKKPTMVTPALRAARAAASACARVVPLPVRARTSAFPDSKPKKIVESPDSRSRTRSSSSTWSTRFSVTQRVRRCRPRRISSSANSKPWRLVQGK